LRVQLSARASCFGGALALAALALCGSSNAHAYSSFADYTRPIQEGGGGGRLFSGTPADPYACEVCHRGAEGAPLQVIGLPEQGYVPGQNYEISLSWPAATPHTALMAEFTDLAGQPSGSSALAPYATWTAGELCAENGFPAADLCRPGAASGCCRDLEPTRDACSFPGERSVLWVLDCGSRAARMLWTAPNPPIGDVWFSSSMVTSNLENDALGDGVAQVRRRLRVAGSPAQLDSLGSGCQLIAGASLGSGSSALLVAFALAFGWRNLRGKRAWARRLQTRVPGARGSMPPAQRQTE
jgi:hypothetical protein